MIRSRSKPVREDKEVLSISHPFRGDGFNDLYSTTGLELLDSKFQVKLCQP
jgi:hypothetical protein